MSFVLFEINAIEK